MGTGYIVQQIKVEECQEAGDAAKVFTTF